MYRIMVIDDEPFALSTISRFIIQQFPSVVQVETFSRSADALAAFSANSADIVLTDIRMPGMDGLELIEQLQALNHFFIPIIVSGYSEFAYARKALQLEVMYYALKPLDFAELKKSLTAAINKVQQHHAITIGTSSRKQNQELFFIDLISRRISSQATLKDSFESHHFPFSLERSSGVLLRISTVSTAEDTYNPSTFSNVWENLVQMVLQPLYVCTLFRTPNHYDLIIIMPNAASTNYDALCQQAELLLHISIKAQPLSSFSSLAEFLSAESETAPTPESAPGLQAKDCNASIRLAIAYMEQHYPEDLTRETVANTVYMSASYFSKLFKQETGIGFSDYLTQIRMKKAIALLSSNMKIQDISKAVGYQSQNRFLINFRNYTSYTPGEYRKTVLKMLR